MVEYMGNRNSLTVGEIEELLCFLRKTQDDIQEEIDDLDEKQESLARLFTDRIDQIDRLISRLKEQRIQ